MTTKEPAAVIAELERELLALEHAVTNLRTQADAEAKLSVDWEDRAIQAVHELRDVLARDALRHVEEHRNAADTLAMEASATEETAHSYRRAIAAIRATHADVAQ